MWRRNLGAFRRFVPINYQIEYFCQYHASIPFLPPQTYATIALMTQDASPLKKKILVSGIKSTGRPHIGNYFGAMKQFVDLQHEYDTRIFIADFHSITTMHNGAELAQATLDLAIDYLAVGLDAEHTTIFKQSDIPELTELCWIFNCLTTMPYLMRAHAYKDAEAKSKEINVGVFDYPVLMTADILIQSAHIVPVGRDQKQHIEIARDIAEKFNRTYCDEGDELLTVPDGLILEAVETVPGIDGQKMSKSYNNHIPLFSTDEEIHKLVFSIVTDSGTGIPANVYAIHRLLVGAPIHATNTRLASEEALLAFYEEYTGKYKALKDALVEDLQAFIRPLRERRAEIAKDPDHVRKLLARNGEHIRTQVHPLVYEMRKKVGLVI